MTCTDIARGRSRDGTDHKTTAVLGACRQQCLISAVLFHLSTATTWTDIASGRSRDGTDHSTTAGSGACIWCHS